jgi:CRP-like cAMP-binding protein
MGEATFNISRLSQILRKVDLFEALKMHQVDELISRMRMSKFNKGAAIITQGDPGFSFFLIGSGRVSVWIKKAFNKSKVAELFPDQFFGEMALISNEPRSATIIAEEPTEVFVLQRTDFDKILMKNPTAAQELRKIFNERKQRNK